jgi:hypothetical protein
MGSGHQRWRLSAADHVYCPLPRSVSLSPDKWCVTLQRPTGVRDARITAGQARMRNELQPVCGADRIRDGNVILTEAGHVVAVPHRWLVHACGASLEIRGDQGTQHQGSSKIIDGGRLVTPDCLDRECRDRH